MTIWIWWRWMTLKHQLPPQELVLALHEGVIKRHQRIALSSTNPSSYCILIGLEKPLSDSLWNESLDLVEMDDAETSSSSTRIAASAPQGGNQATSTYRPIIDQSIKVLHIDWA